MSKIEFMSLAEKIADGIKSGIYQDTLPSIARLSEKFDVCPATVKRVLSQLRDWDLVDGQGRLDAEGRRQLPHSLFLDRVRSPYNIGAVFRSAESFCVDHIYLRRGCGDVTSPRCARTARGATETVPYTIVDDLEVLKGRTVFALETGGEALSSFSFPEDAVCVIGSEEDGVSADVLGMCSSRVTIEQFGSKGSINVSVACGILLHAWALYGV